MTDALIDRARELAETINREKPFHHEATTGTLLALIGRLEAAERAVDQSDWFETPEYLAWRAIRDAKEGA